MARTSDGHTLLLTTDSSMSINPHLFSKLPYDAVRDFLPVSQLVLLQQLMLAHPSLPANTIGELIALAKQRPGEITYGSSGYGAAGHVNVALLEGMTGIKLAPVHYRGASPALNDVLAGESVQLMFATIPSAINHIRAGKLRALAVTSLRRSGGLPEVPTVAESGVPGFDASS